MPPCEILQKLGQEFDGGRQYGVVDRGAQAADGAVAAQAREAGVGSFLQAQRIEPGIAEELGRAPCRVRV